MTAERLALWWVERYTRGLPPALRAERRAEIASDVWEHRRSAGDGVAAGLAILSRCARGVPADLSWRRSRRRRRPLPGPTQLLRGLGWAFAGLSYAVLLGQHAWFATALLGLDLYGEDWQPGDVTLWSRLGGVLVLALVTGALLLRAAPRAGVALIASAATTTAVAMWWALPILAPVAVAATTGAAVLARRRRATRAGRTAVAG